MPRTMIKHSVLLLLMLITTACAAAASPEPAPPTTEDQTAVPDQLPEVEDAATAVQQAAPTAVPLPVLAPAPDWNNDVWINTDSPLRLADVQGKVVLLEFWTFG